MRRRSVAESYDLRSNIKGKPGSQGTLFQVKDKSLLNPQQRWPRGYSPERQAEVRGALDRVRFTTRNVNAHEPEQRARVTDTLARSTAPVRHLSFLQQVDDTPDEGTEGVYYPQSKRLHVDMHGAGKGDEGREQTLLHELGHHHANTTPKGGDTVRGDLSRLGEDRARRHMPSHAEPDAPLTGTARAMGAQEVKRGVEEAYADNYMNEHYRTRGRNPQPVTQGRYEEHFPSPHQRDELYPGYNAVRPPRSEHMGPQFHQERLF